MSTERRVRERPVRPPILVTGTYRSGTTWAGGMLAQSPRLHLVHEPFAPMHERAWVRDPAEIRMFHQPVDAPAPFAEDLDRIVALQPPWLAIARRAGGFRNAARLLQEASVTTVARRRGARAVIKDPFALLMAEWIASRSGASVVVLVRHPAAFVSSVKRLSWRLPVTGLLSQSSLVDGDLAPFVAELEADRRGATDLIDHACLVWCALNTVVRRYERDHPEWAVLRYEDLALDPVAGFRDLYQRLDVRWDERIERSISAHNAPRHGADVGNGSKGGTKRDSRKAAATWMHRLSEAEIARTRAQTEDVADHWYADEDW